MSSQASRKRRHAEAVETGRASFSAGSAAASPKRPNRRGKKSRDRIIEAAQRILIEDGYAGLSMARLREEANASSASLYHHFGDKAGLLTAVLERTVNENAQRFDEVSLKSDRVLEQVENFFDAVKSIRGDGSSNTAAIIMAMAEAGAESADMPPLAARANRFAERFIADRFADYFDIDDGRFFAHIHIAFALYLTHAARAGLKEPELAEIFTSYRKLMLIACAAARPDFMDDPDFAAAVREASRAPRRPNSQQGEKKHGRPTDVCERDS